jgi:hypothetical protein
MSPIILGQLFKRGNGDEKIDNVELHHLGEAEVVGIAIGCAIAVALLAVTLSCILLRRKRTKDGVQEIIDRPRPDSSQSIQASLSRVLTDPQKQHATFMV